MLKIFFTVFIACLAFNLSTSDVIDSEDQTSREKINYEFLDGISEVPYHVQLIINDVEFCGGSLISNNLVLTSPRCAQMAQKTSTPILVYAGSNKLREGVEIRESKSPENFYFISNDVGSIIPLSKPFENKMIKNVPMATKPLRRGDKVFMSGFGALDPQTNEYSLVIKHMEGTVVRCEDLNMELCVKFEDLAQVCEGDLGNGLVNKDGELVAVIADTKEYIETSNGSKNVQDGLCSVEGIVYAPVARDMKFIKLVIDKEYTKKSIKQKIVINI